MDDFKLIGKENNTSGIGVVKSNLCIVDEHGSDYSKPLTKTKKNVLCLSPSFYQIFLSKRQSAEQYLEGGFIMVLVNKIAPDFTAKAVVQKQIVENFTLSDFRGEKYVLLFFYPLDFTFVCPTELHAFQEKLEEFTKRNVEVVGVSTDSWFSHLAWLNLSRKHGGIEGVTYPLVSDFTKKISRDYDVLIEEEGIALRGLFLIDRNGIVQHQLVNNLPLGRSVDEALQFTEIHGEVCPANWQKGKKAMNPNEDGLKEFFAVEV